MLHFNTLIYLIFLFFLTIFFYIIQRKQEKSKIKITTKEIEKLNLYDKMLLSFLNDNESFYYYKYLFERFANKKIFSICPQAFLNIFFHQLSKKMYLSFLVELLILLTPTISLELKIATISLMPFILNYLFYLKFKYKYEFTDQYYKTEHEKLLNMKSNNSNLKKIKIFIFLFIFLFTGYFSLKTHREFKRIKNLQELSKATE